MNKQPLKRLDNSPLPSPLAIPWAAIGEVRVNDDGTVDEIVAEGVSVHLERVSDGGWRMRLGGATGSATIFLATRRGAPIRSTATIDDSVAGFREIGFVEAGWKRKD